VANAAALFVFLMGCHSCTVFRRETQFQVEMIKMERSNCLRFVLKFVRPQKKGEEKQGLSRPSGKQATELFPIRDLDQVISLDVFLYLVILMHKRFRAKHFVTHSEMVLGKSAAARKNLHGCLSRRKNSGWSFTKRILTKTSWTLATADGMRAFGYVVRSLSVSLGAWF
jgi:hypothetical protein